MISVVRVLGEGCNWLRKTMRKVAHITGTNIKRGGEEGAKGINSSQKINKEVPSLFYRFDLRVQSGDYVQQTAGINMIY